MIDKEEPEIVDSIEMMFNNLSLGDLIELKEYLDKLLANYYQ